MYSFKSVVSLSLTSLAFLSLSPHADAPVHSAGRCVQPGKPYNVLMIIIDDVAAQIQSADNNMSPVQTPNIKRIASKGTWFKKAYNDAPVCCGSRTAMLTGVHATRSGVYYNTQPYRRSGTWIADALTFPANFKKHGYLTASFGKLVHNSYQADNSADFTPGYYKMYGNRAEIKYNDDMLLTQIIPGSRREIPGITSTNWGWGILPDSWDRTDTTQMQQDTEQANRSVDFLRSAHDQPFFLSCGFWRPHVRWTVPKRYYEMFPLDKIKLPDGYRPDDMEDLPKPGRWLAMHRGEHEEVVAGAMWKKALQSYYASMAYVDEQIGKLLDALEKSAYSKNTIVIFLSDNGMHLGEKNHWLKYALWEQTCRVLFSMSVPGMPNITSTTPVGLIDIYPTLINLCKLGRPHQAIDGVDLTAILTGGAASRGKPVLSTYGQGNHAIRDDNFRYIHYRNGDEELYDHRKDPYEWNNLALDPAYKGTLTKLAAFLPRENAAGVKEVEMIDNSRWKDEAFQ